MADTLILHEVNKRFGNAAHVSKVIPKRITYMRVEIEMDGGSRDARNAVYQIQQEIMGKFPEEEFDFVVTQTGDKK